jgi:hypothetical protein
VSADDVERALGLALRHVVEAQRELNKARLIASHIDPERRDAVVRAWDATQDAVNALNRR